MSLIPVHVDRVPVSASVDRPVRVTHTGGDTVYVGHSNVTPHEYAATLNDGDTVIWNAAQHVCTAIGPGNIPLSAVLHVELLSQPTGALLGEPADGRIPVYTRAGTHAGWITLDKE